MVEGTFFRHASPVGELRVYATRKGIRAIRFEDDLRTAEAELSGGALELLARRELDRYFEGKPTAFTVPLDLDGMGDFQRAALTTLAAKVPWGAVTTYGELARWLGKKPGAARAIGQAMGRNPIPIVLPCHRVLAAGEAIGGFSGGLDRKRILLALEGRRVAEQASLF